jgi:clan AA aspartic protease
MISGRINSRLEAVISLSVIGSQGEVREVEAVIDTGFSDYLTLPVEVVTALGLSSIGVEQLTLADGSEITADLCPVTIIWDGQPRAVEADTLESEALVGMALMKGYDLNARIAVGGRVTIESFSPTQPPTT